MSGPREILIIGATDTSRFRVEPLMEEPAETREETRRSRGFGSYVFWTVMVLVLYVLSWGPFVMMERKGIWERPPVLLEGFYFPIYWAYSETVLHKPVGMYLRLWCPQGFTTNGDVAE